MAASADIQPIQNFEVTPETLEFTTGADTRNISIKHFLCLRRTLPKTRLSQAILYENVSYTRQLSMRMETMQKNRQRQIKLLDSNLRAFRQTQKRKQAKWKRVDEVRLSNMNLPCVNLSSENERPKSCKIMYRMQEFKPEGDQPESPKPVLPKMNLCVRREQTEIITHRDKTFMTRFPELIEIDPKLLERHNMYCGKYLLEGGSGRDTRFYKCMGALSPATVDNHYYPLENMSSMSRLFKYAPREGGTTPRSAKTVSRSQQQHLKEDVAKRFDAIKSRENSNLSDSILDDKEPKSGRAQKTVKTPRQSGRFQKRGEYILETYRSEDNIQLRRHKRSPKETIPEESPEVD